VQEEDRVARSLFDIVHPAAVHLDVVRGEGKLGRDGFGGAHVGSSRTMPDERTDGLMPRLRRLPMGKVSW
jgi:hypothetical protein